MAGPEYPDAPPPEVPEEFAAAYREAYRRALDGDGVPTPAPAAVDLGDVALRGSGSRRWLVPALLCVGALLLVSAAYGAGRVLSDDSLSPVTDPARHGSVHTPRPAPSQAGGPSATPAPGGWQGAVTAVEIGAVSADCTAAPGRDSAGRRVDYVPENVRDGRPGTAWRCPGTASGQALVLRLGAAVDVGEVGLIPGYAKTDAADGADRYAENNRITRVRWTLADGVTVVQRLDPDPRSRMPQLLRVPRTTTDRVTLEILAVQRGSRNTTAISEVFLAAAS